MQGTQFTKKKLNTYGEFSFLESNRFPSILRIQNFGGVLPKVDSVGDMNTNKNKMTAKFLIIILICQLLDWMKSFISESDHFCETFFVILWRFFFLKELESPHFRIGIL